MKLSIITINLNDAIGLRKSIESVVNQTFSDYEFIIIDGSSIDVSIDVIKEYNDKISYWVSEPDKGIYNAMNKGILKASGDYCLFLNSGDYLINDYVLNEILSKEYTEDILYGDLITDKNKVIIFPDKITLGYFYKGSFGHAASFIKRDILIKYGLYNENNKIVSDWEFFVKSIFIDNSTFKHINKTISVFNSEGISSNKKFMNLLTYEKEVVLKKLFPLMADDYINYEKCKSELNNYKNSTLVQLVKKFQTSKIYLFFRSIM